MNTQQHQTRTATRGVAAPVVAGIGEILWDMLPQGERLGGAPTNFVLHAHALGARARIVSALGNDEPGREILRQLAAKGVDHRYIAQGDHPTGKVEVLIDPQGHASYTICEHVAWDYLELSPSTLTLAGACDAVCFGSLAQRHQASRETIHGFLAHTREDCLRVFDINLRQNFFNRTIIERSLEAANILKLNDEELLVLQDMLDLPPHTEDALQAIRRQYRIDRIALTLGAAGSIILDGHQLHHCPGAPVAVKDTVGAGDAFTATLVMGILGGLDLEQVNRLACSIGAYVCSQAGAIPTLPEELVTELRRTAPAGIRPTQPPATQRTGQRVH